MKNIIKTILFVAIGLILIVISKINFKNNDSKIEVEAITCSLTNEFDNYKIESFYNIQYKEDIVTAILSVETITSDDEDFIEQYYKDTKEKYDELNSLYGGHTYQIGKNSTTISLRTTIDYSKVNMENLLKNDSTLKEYSNDENQLTFTGMKEYYTNLGMICE